MAQIRERLRKNGNSLDAHLLPKDPAQVHYLARHPVVALLVRVPQYCDEVTRGPRDNKQVPDEMTVTDPLIN